jgi:hypothetical protein
VADGVDGAPLEGELPYPKTVAALAAFMDSLPPSQERVVRWRLGSAKRAAEAANDARLIEAIDAEGNAYLFFGEERTLAAALVEVRTYFNDAMIDYLRDRRETSPAPILRARYGHVIAAYTRRHDEGLRAVGDYVTAVEHYRLSENEQRLETLHALQTLVPLMVSIGRKYRAREQVLPALLATVRTTNPYLRKLVFEVIVADATITRDALEPLRDDALRTITELRGAMELSDIQAMADLGIRLDARLARTDRSPWLRALADVYRNIIVDSAAHPLTKEQAAQRAALVFQELGDNAGWIEMIQFQREYAGQGLEYHSFSHTLDDTGEMADYIRGTLDKLFEEGGALRVLGYLGLSADIMPTMGNARLSLQSLEAQGIGVFSQLATTLARAADKRVVGHGQPGRENQERSEREQFGFGWIYATYAMAVSAQATISNGSVTIDDFVALLVETWIGEDEASQANDLVALLTSPLRIYFGLITNGQHDDAMVVTIDSLALRFEAVIRKLARRLGEPDWIQRTDNSGRPITEVLGLGLLNNERVAAYLGEDLHAFATYTLARHDEGLRDKIAHAATHVGDYTMQNAHALVFLLLRLAMHQGCQPIRSDTPSTFTDSPS